MVEKESRYVKRKDINSIGIEFQLKSLDVKERFQVWSVNENKFYNEGEKLKTPSGEKTVNKFIKLTDEEKVVFRRNLSFVRTVLVNDSEKVLDMPVTAHDKLTELLALMGEAGVDPLDYTFVISRTGAGLNTVWSIKRGVRIGKNGVNHSSIPSVKVPVTLELTPNERGIVAVFKQAMVERKLDSKAEQVVRAYTKGLTDNNIDPARAEAIYREYLY